MTDQPQTNLDEDTPPLERKSGMRRFLMIGVPLIGLTALTVMWLNGGRYVGTDNAYIKAQTAIIATDVGGIITDIHVSENQSVQAGQLLFKLDSAPYEIALAQADAGLATLVTEIEGLKASYKQLSVRLKAAEEDLAYQRRDLERKEALASRKHTSDAALDNSRHRVAQAEAAVNTIVQEQAGVRARLGGNPNIAVHDHPRYREASVRREQAALHLAHTKIYAPIDGTASQTPHVGEFARPGANLMSIVSQDRIWVEANMKETDLSAVQTGQHVSISIDLYPDYEWEGFVTSISPATGSEFSILPPQNATGNWVKVVQRIPVRIGFEQAAGAPKLRAGLSAEVSIDTGRSRSLTSAFRDIFSSGEPLHGSPVIAR